MKNLKSSIEKFKLSLSNRMSSLMKYPGRMTNISIKAKLLVMLIALSVISLGIFGKISLDLYKKDKLAFVYDSLASEAQSKSTLISANIKTYDLLITNLLTGLDLKLFKLKVPTLKFLQNQEEIFSVYYHIPLHKTLKYKVLMEGIESNSVKWNWKMFESAPFGLNPIDLGKDVFFYKKQITINNNKRDKGFALIVFKNRNMSDFFQSSKTRKNFMFRNGEILSNNSISIEKAELKRLSNTIKNSQGVYGLFEFKIKKENHIVSFAKILFTNLTVVSVVAEKTVMLVQELFFWKIMAFLVFIASFSLLVGTVASRWLTWRIDQLTKAAVEVSNENFDYKVRIDSMDELGILGSSFNTMSGKIKKLLDELRRYNTELEGMVAERTAELQHLTNIQEAMLNSLGQGFVIFNKDNEILSIYSKIAQDMFEAKPDEVKPAVILGANEEDAENLHELFSMAFQKVMTFEDVAPLAPSNRTNKKDQKLELSYAPIKNPESGELEYVLIIGTDKTAELESIEKFNREWKHSQMITKLASNKFTINKLIKESLSMLENCLTALNEEKAFALRDVQRYIHTIKGSFSYFYVENIKSFCHDFETELEAHYDVEKIPNELSAHVIDKINVLKTDIDNFIEEYNTITQYKDSANNKIIPIDVLDEFKQKLTEKNRKLAEEFESKFYKSKIAPHFQMYPTIIHDLAIKLNKKVEFKIEGADLLVPDYNWEELFSQFVHFIRNSVDHGIETKHDREERNKPEVGTISFKFELSDDEENLIISLSDDGNGIDWKKLAKVDPSVKSEEDAIELIKKGGTSSKEEVSDISGRGVGVSSLFAAIEKWNGITEVNNNLGHGLEIKMTIPLNKESKKLKMIS